MNASKWSALYLMCLLPCAFAGISDEEARAISQEWRSAKQAVYEGKSDPESVVKAGERYRAMLAMEPETMLQRSIRDRGQWELIDYTTAKGGAGAADYQKAFPSLAKEAAGYGKSGSFLANTRSPDHFACDVFVLHAEIMAHTGKIGPYPGCGYDVFEVPGSGGKRGFVFVYQPEGDDEGGVLIEGLNADVERRKARLAMPDDSGKYRLTDQAEVIAKRGGFSVALKKDEDGVALSLKGVAKVIEYGGHGLDVPAVHPSAREELKLRIRGKEIEKPLDALVRMGGKAGSPLADWVKIMKRMRSEDKPSIAEMEKAAANLKNERARPEGTIKMDDAKFSEKYSIEYLLMVRYLQLGDYQKAEKLLAAEVAAAGAPGRIAGSGARDPQWRAESVMELQATIVAGLGRNSFGEKLGYQFLETGRKGVFIAIREAPEPDFNGSEMVGIPDGMKRYIVYLLEPKDGSLHVCKVLAQVLVAKGETLGVAMAKTSGGDFLELEHVGMKLAGWKHWAPDFVAVEEKVLALKIPE